MQEDLRLTIGQKYFITFVSGLTLEVVLEGFSRDTLDIQLDPKIGGVLMTIYKEDIQTIEEPIENLPLFRK